MILLWLACGYIGCKIAGISNEYMECFIGTSLILVCSGLITLVVAIIIVLTEKETIQ